MFICEFCQREINEKHLYSAGPSSDDGFSCETCHRQGKKKKQPYKPGVISHHAYKAAESIANYCLTRFPCDQPPSNLLDVPWFAEKVQRAIDATIKEIKS